MSGVRQSKITKGTVLAGLGEERLKINIENTDCIVVGKRCTAYTGNLLLLFCILHCRLPYKNKTEFKTVSFVEYFF